MSSVAALIACGGGPRPLAAGTDACDFCRMGVADVRYGAEVVARTGRVYTFDAVECAISWLSSSPQAEGARSIWVSDYSTGTLVDATSALFVKGGTLHSPMGRDITAFASTIDSTLLATTYGGEVLRWDDVVAYIRVQGIPEGPTSAAPSRSRM